ncbi:MAG: hypothetical protein SFY81_07025 [Verrucomicrobiota bacterium]|nr:hypothetical protein [Verrucomicrobiota bacterium]
MKRHLSICLLLSLISIKAEVLISQLQDEIPEAGIVLRERMTFANHAVSLILPSGWLPFNPVGSNGLSTRTADQKLQLSIEFSTNSLSSALLEATVQKRFPGAIISERDECHSGIGSGPMLTLTLPEPSVPEVIKIAQIPSTRGSIYIIFAIERGPYENYHHLWANLLNSLRVES